MALEYLRQYVKAAPSAPVPGPEDYQPDQSRFPADLTTPAGGSLYTDTAIPAASLHGPHPFSALRTVAPGPLATICHDPQLAYADLNGAVFLDTETTGLNMGTGTYVFLVGAGYLDGDTFRVRQYFLRSPGEEEIYLRALGDFLQQFNTLVTFNGRAFDWPLLENRYIRHRSLRVAPLDDPPHIDLLQPARRIWKRRLDNCRLSSLEQQILGVARTGNDVPGWLIPSLYFAYLRHGNPRTLQGVFYHNLQDILSLASLTVHIHGIVSDPLGGLIDHGLDFLCLARFLDRARYTNEAAACLEQALRRSLTPAERSEALMHLAAIHKRDGRYELALPLWDRVIDDAAAELVPALIQRAMYFEHVERSYLEALDDVQRALNVAELDPAAVPNQQELEHRRGRLLHRVYRSRQWRDEL